MKSIVLILGSVLIIISSGFARTIHVPGGEPTIQAGIDAAVDGDIVLVAQGTFTGSGNKDLEITGKSIAVMSENGPESTIIDCWGIGRGVWFHGNDTESSLDGFTIKNGYKEGNGGAIYCMDNSSPSITNCVIIGNTADDDGGGIYCSSEAHASITNCSISGNHSDHCGGGICCRFYSSLIIADCTISGNFAPAIGAGINLWYCSGIITNCDISGNAGTGIDFHKSSGTIDDCTISDNTSSVDIGGISISESDIDINNSIISGNHSENRAGGIFCSQSSLLNITNSLITDNTSGGGCGGIDCYYESSLIITNCTISANSSSWGGGLYCQESSSSVTNCILWGNTPEEIYISSATLSVTYSDIQGGWEGEGNIDSDPLFICPDDKDFHIKSDSPCIDRGTDQDTPEFDFEGDARFDHPDMPDDPTVWDMGADECTNLPPEDFSLSLPTDGEIIESSPILFDWEDTEDPENDDVVYMLYYDIDPTFSTQPESLPGLSESECLLEAGLSNFETYFWKVQAHDGRGGETWSREIFSFSTYLPEAVLEVEPDSFEFILLFDESDEDTLYISNTGNIDLEYLITWNQDWLYVASHNGIVPPGGMADIELFCSAEGLDVGTHTDTLTISTNALEDPVRRVTVRLTVRSSVIPEISCEDPDVARGDYLDIHVKITNIGEEERAFKAWLDLYLIGGKPYNGNPVEGPFSRVLGPGDVLEVDYRGHVPMKMPVGGPYTLYLRVGESLESPWSDDSFAFHVIP